MGDAENDLPLSKKRSAGRELTKDNAGLDDEEDTSEQEAGTFKKASDEVLATRRIVKVRRQQTTSAPSSNPFAGICLVPPKDSSATSAEVTTEAQTAGEKTVSDDVDGKDETGKETEKDKDEDEKQSESKTDEAVDASTADKENAVEEENSNVVNEATDPKVDNEQAAEGEKTEDEEKKDDKNVDSGFGGAPLSSFQQLSSSQNAFTGLAGTGISTSTFSFGSILKDGSALGTGSVSIFGVKDDKPFGLGHSNNGNSSVSKSEGSGFPSMQEVVVETGEENEKAVFTADSVMFEFVDGGWKERGKGELKVNVSTTGTDKARLLMRAKGNYRLILNASLYPDMKLTNMDKKGITFACINSASEGKEGLSTFALKFKDVSIVEEFRAAVTVHKSKTSTVLKTPENSPKASDD